ncbi:protein-L-isoaspartate O-methyltransferase [bacterium (Candidatus Gribaldobacteria) CG_4_10_14_0_8_um_filter_33_9]|uniref:Protein-L-isoaspartate O-methyltransferase n=1 Tax=bacterium (Candidatus Gribaldobacteria) CG_4_10_14_0_8_um_filter_33_9 TaxID=2014266 RepID=A0A2M7RMX7_9BACT|nr:MAG: protein-L-isoaspartate O-methyltransferase [bacterium (Candidatus Gribaldobacteria) CG_4_10_14_0_8_um_filter_33_9]
MLIDNLIEQGWLKTPRIIDAFRKIKRTDFMSNNNKSLSELNQALSIGCGQTISQPLTVAFMLEQLQPQLGDKILDVGSGSGWTSALLAHIVSGEKLKSKINGQVIAIEAIPDLKEFGERNTAKYNYIKRGIAKFICGDGSKGYIEEAPYDKILCSAEAKKLPETWKKQLKIGGKIVAPIGSSIWLFIKKNETEFEQIEFPGFAFVPLIEK